MNFVFYCRQPSLNVYQNQKWSNFIQKEIIEYHYYNWLIMINNNQKLFLSLSPPSIPLCMHKEHNRVQIFSLLLLFIFVKPFNVDIKSPPALWPAKIHQKVLAASH